VDSGFSLICVNSTFINLENMIEAGNL